MKVWAMGTVACGDLSGMGYEVIGIRNAPRLVKQAVLKAKRAHTPERSVPRASSRATPYPIAPKAKRPHTQQFYLTAGCWMLKQLKQNTSPNGEAF